MVWRNLFILGLMTLLCSGSASDPHPHCSTGSCGQGHRIDTNGNCIKCDKGTFMPFQDHACKTCFSCSLVASPDEMIVTPCTDRHDTHIVCKPGYFTTGHNTPTMRSCTKCQECTSDEYLWRACTDTRDTECRPVITTNATVLKEESTGLDNFVYTTTLPTTTTNTTYMVVETIGSSSSINATTDQLVAITNSSIVISIVIVAVLVLLIINVFIIRKNEKDSLTEGTLPDSSTMVELISHKNEQD